MSIYQQHARQTYGPYTTITGDGQWCLEKRGGGVALFSQEQNAREVMAARGGKLVRLMPKRLELKEWPD